MNPKEATTKIKEMRKKTRIRTSTPQVEAWWRTKFASETAFCPGFDCPDADETKF